MDILMVCTGNTCRSAMAEGLLKDVLAAYGLDEHYVTSAGISTVDGLPASQNAVSAAGELGSDISLHTSKQITKSAVISADLILCMTEGQKDYLLNHIEEGNGKTYTLAEFVEESDMEISDPFGGDMEEYRECIADINMLVEKLAEKLDLGEIND